MNCSEYRKDLTALLYGELDRKRLMEIHRHLGECETCLKEEMELRKTINYMNQARLDAFPENFDSELFSKVRKIRKPYSAAYSLLRKRFHSIAATVIIVLGLQILGYFLWNLNAASNDFAKLQEARPLF